MFADRGPSCGLVLICNAPILLSFALWKLGHPFLALLCYGPSVGMLVYVSIKDRRRKREVLASSLKATDPHIHSELVDDGLVLIPDNDAWAKLAKNSMIDELGLGGPGVLRLLWANLEFCRRSPEKFVVALYKFSPVAKAWGIVFYAGWTIGGSAFISNGYNVNIADGWAKRQPQC